MYRLHLQSIRDDHPSFHVTPAVWAAAAARNPQLASRVSPSYGWSDEPFPEAEMLLVSSSFSKPAVNAAADLRWIHTAFAGLEKLAPLAELREDILLTNSRGIHGDKAREFVTMALLMLRTGMARFQSAQREHRWDPVFTPPLHGARAVVVGFGAIGQEVGRGLLGMGLEVTGVSRSGAASPIAREAANRLLAVQSIDTCLSIADYVILAAPLTPETRNLLNARRLGALKTGVGIVNIGRAALLDHDALVAGLRTGAIGGAFLDVFEREPLPAGSELWDVPGLVLTPHVSCDVPDYAQRVLDTWFRNFDKFLRQEPLDNLVDRQGY